MILRDRERVDGTRVSIGRRVQVRTDAGGTRHCESSAYSAVYIDVDGHRREQGLGTTNKREARRKAIEIDQRLTQGTVREVARRLTMADLLTQYAGHVAGADLAPKSRAKYAADLAKLTAFANEDKLVHADQFDEHRFARYRGWLAARKHKQGVAYSSKSIYAALTLVKQVFKLAWQRKLLPDYALATAKLPKARPRPQPCFTTAQVEAVLTHLAGNDHAAIAILAYSGMRVGELIQLTWKDVRLPGDRLGMFHIHRGGSRGTTKDKEERFVPIHPRIRPILDTLPRSGERVLPGLRDRTLLARLKNACAEAGLGKAFKVHSLRHHFASLVANHQVSYKKALAWLGHSDSEMLSNYYHLHDEESERSMRALAESSPWSPPEVPSPRPTPGDSSPRPPESAPCSESTPGQADAAPSATGAQPSATALTPASSGTSSAHSSAAAVSDAQSIAPDTHSIAHDSAQPATSENPALGTRVQKGARRGTHPRKHTTPGAQAAAITAVAGRGSTKAERGSRYDVESPRSQCGGIVGQTGWDKFANTVATKSCAMSPADSPTGTVMWISAESRALGA